jgi:flagellar protein FlaI
MPRKSKRYEIFTPVDIVSNNMASPEILAYFWFSIDLGVSTIILGPRGMHERQYLEAISFFLPPKAKVASISMEGWRFHAVKEWQDVRGAKKDFTRLLDSISVEKTDYIFADNLNIRALKTALKIMPSKPIFSSVEFKNVKELVKNSKIPKKNLVRVHILPIVNNIEDGALKSRMTEIVEIVGWNRPKNQIVINRPFWWEAKLFDEFFFSGHSFLYEMFCESRNIKPREIGKLISERVDLIKWLTSKAFKPEKTREEILNYYKDRKVIEKCRKDLKSMGYPKRKVPLVKARLDWI